MQQLRHQHVAVARCNICHKTAVWVDDDNFAYCETHQPIAAIACAYCGRALPDNSHSNRQYCDRHCLNEARREARRVMEPA